MSYTKEHAENQALIMQIEIRARIARIEHALEDAGARAEPGVVERVAQILATEKRQLALLEDAEDFWQMVGALDQVKAERRAADRAR